jgi:uncharacterized membrane protein HdeD (DUF308 family)
MHHRIVSPPALRYADQEGGGCELLTVGIVVIRALRELVDAVAARASGRTLRAVGLLLPGMTLWVLVLLFGAYALVDGIFVVVAGIRGAGGSRRWVLIIEGMLSILAGIVALLWPGITALVLLYVIAFWAIFTGVAEIVAAVALRREIEGEWALIQGGVLSVIFGIILAVLPGVGLLSLVWLIGIYAILFGIALIALAFRVRVMRGQRNRRVA